MSVRTDLHGPVSVITLDRPDRRNAFDEAMTAALDRALNDFEDDPGQSVAVITGGPEFFSAGTDVSLWAGPPTARGGAYGIAGRHLTKPLIAAVEGVAAGGGFEIVLATTMVAASTSATFSFPEAGLGLVAECGGLFRGPRALPLNVARELLLTGRPLTAERAWSLGLVNVLTEPGRALAGALDLASRVDELAPIARRESLLAVESLYRDADEIAWQATEHAKAAVRASRDHREGVAAFLGKREPIWHGS